MEEWKEREREEETARGLERGRECGVEDDATHCQKSIFDAIAAARTCENATWRVYDSTTALKASAPSAICSVSGSRACGLMRRETPW